MKITIKKLLITGVCMLLYSLFLFQGFPAMVRWAIKHQIALRPGSEVRGLWSKLPWPLDFKIYLFNVTNAEEIEEGKKPKLQEVGPFFYDEYRWKVDLVDRDEDDSVEYSVKNTWYFNPQKSNGLTGNEEMVLPHLIMLGMIGATMREKPGAIGIIGKAIKSIFHDPKSIFVKMKARDILFDGMPIDCTVTDFAGSAVCNVLKSAEQVLMSDGENRYKFALLGVRNGTAMDHQRLRVRRGIKNYKEVGRVLEWAGKPALDIWPDDHCNQYNGTDTTIFPPLFGPEDDITTFAYDICRSISAYFTRYSKIKGVKALHYTADLGDMSTNPWQKCFCPTPTTCLTKNLYDLTKCLQVPIIASLPHFLNSDEMYLNMVEGLQPDEAKHAIEIDIDGMTAVPLHARNRLQFNMFVQPIPKLKLMKNFPNALFPLLWLEEGILIDDSIVLRLKLLYKMIALANFSKWLMIIGALGTVVASSVLYYKQRLDKTIIVTEISEKSAPKKDKTEKEWQPGMIRTIRAAPVPDIDKY